VKGFTVALVGGDGAGKTTVARALEASGDPVACRYLYMGQSVHSSDRALPTSRLARAAKGPEGAPLPPEERPKAKGEKRKRRGRFRAAFSLLNRLAEATWRRVLIWRTTRRGLVVVCDRHFLWEAATYAGEPGTGGERFDRFEIRAMQVLGEPDLVLFLDASPEVMFERKGETSVRRLTRRRAKIVERGERTTNFVRIDADREPEAVLADVRTAIAGYAADRGVAVARAPR
jgi:thymidylate kinase